METLETIAEMVECTAFVVGKLADMGKKGAESNEDLPTPAEEKAKQTQELVHQVQIVNLFLFMQCILSNMWT